VKVLSQQQGEASHFVSPWWVVRSIAKGELVSEQECPPIFSDDPTPVNKKKEKQAALTSKGKALLKGSLFCLLRVTPPEWAVDFDTKQVERDILSNGGKLLSMKLVEALKVDHAPSGFVSGSATNVNAPKDATSAKRTCYVVAWGGATQSHLDIHPLLSQIKRQSLCRLVQVSPIWLSTCITEQRLLQPSRNPCLFEPGKRPIHWLFHPNAQKGLMPGSAASDDATSHAVRISVTGFSGSIRTALMHAVKAIGATYDDSMLSTTTHLICREASGAKYEKAVEWKIRVVSMEWLFHVMQHGYEGVKGLKGGCESEFTIHASQQADLSR
jgi:twin BRCT domain